MIELAKIIPLNNEIKCPNPDCNGTKFIPFEEVYDGEWIYLKLECLNCYTVFQVDYRAVNLDTIEEQPDLTVEI